MVLGRGIGTDLYTALFAAVADEDIYRIVAAGITLANTASVTLHERFGFRKVVTFSANERKFDQSWDVAWLFARVEDELREAVGGRHKDAHVRPG